MKEMKEIQPMDPMLRKLLPPEQPKQGVVYVPSLYAMPFEHEGRRYVFNILTQQCLETELPARCMAGEGYDGLIAAFIMVPEGKDECTFYESTAALLRTFERKKGHPAFTILPTLRCNARCIYCYESGMPQTTMSAETTEQVIRFIRETHAGEPVFINWFGGEPLFCPQVIDRVCEGLREAGLDYVCEMVSNGSLVTPEILSKMTGDWHLKKIQISMDGAEEDYIARKQYYVQRDQYHQVIAGIRMLAEAGIRVTIRCNSDPHNWGGMRSMLDDLKRGIPDKQNVAFYFCSLNHVRESDENLAMWRRFLELEPEVRAAGFRVAGMPDGRMRVFHCMADGNSVVISPDGSLYPCEHCPPKARFGDVYHGVTDEAARKAFCDAFHTREKCRQCPYLPECTSFSACPVQDWHCREVKELGKELMAQSILGERPEEEKAGGC